MKTRQVDGNNIGEVVRGVREVAEDVRTNSEPYLVEMVTFRMRGHEEASGTKYYPDGLQDEWSVKDPIHSFEQFLLDHGLLTEAAVADARKEIMDEVNQALKIADSESPVVFDLERELADRYAPFSTPVTNPTGAGKDMRLIDAISDGLDQAMQKHPNLVLMGQDIADYGGVFKVTQGFTDRYGKGRVRNTPLCESAILGAGLGLSINGHKAMVEMQFADFVSEGMTQICNNLAKIHWRWGQQADVVVRMPTGAGVAAGPFHSQSNEAWFTHIPGLQVAYPAFPADAKGLLLRAFEDPNPVMFFEHKALYRSITGEVPEGYYTLPFGKAATLRQGNGVTVVTYGMGVHWALEVLDKHPEISADLIDLRTLVPLDEETIIESVKRTGKALVFHEDVLIGGFGGEIASRISERCFEYLDGPVARVGSINTAVPFAAELEQGFLPKARFEEKLIELAAY